MLKDSVILHSLFVFFGIVGALARIGLSRLTQYQGAHYGGVLWANFAGSLIMGLLAQNLNFFGDVLDDKIPHRRGYKNVGEVMLYTALSTGLCGSITSFSSFELELFEVSVLDAWNFPNGGYGVMSWLNYCIVTLAVSITGYKIGIHITKAFLGDWVFPLAKYERIIEITLSVVGLCGWIVSLVLAIVKPTTYGEWRYWSLSCVFAPFGVILRYWLSKLFNTKFKTFKLGTFLANMLGTIVIAVLLLFQRGNSINYGKLVTSKTSCHVLSALQNGFCGNLTTISSFVAELMLSPKLLHAYIYGSVTVIAGYAIMILIAGSWHWTHGLVATCSI